MEVNVTVNGTDYSKDVEPRILLVDFIRTNLGPDRDAHRVRHDFVWSLHRSARWQTGQVLHDICGAGQRLLDQDG